MFERLRGGSVLDIWLSIMCVPRFSFISLQVVCSFVILTRNTFHPRRDDYCFQSHYGQSHVAPVIVSVVYSGETTSLGESYQ